jgi:hypothetical protein
MITYRAFEFFIEHDIHEDVLRRWSVLADPSDSAYSQTLSATYDSHYANLVDSLRARKIAFGVIMIPSKMDLMTARYPEGDFFRR